MTRSPFDDPDALQRLLEGEPAADGAGTEEARAFLDGLRRELLSRQTCSQEPGARADALAQRVLACTTREDLSWRGDLRLVGRFVRERLVHSPALRLAAALLLLQLLLVPGVLAYLSLVRPKPAEPDLFVDFEAPVEAPLVREEPDGERNPDLRGVDPRVVPVEQGLDGLAFAPDPDNARQWDRFHLEPGLPLAPEASDDRREASLEQVLRERSLGRVADVEPEDPDVAFVLRALQLEAALDRLALSREAPQEAIGAEREVCLGALARLAELLEVRGFPDGAAQSLLCGAALARAEAHGVASPASRGSLAVIRALGDARLLGPELRRGGPAGEAWRACLAQALEELGVDGPVARAWR